MRAIILTAIAKKQSSVVVWTVSRKRIAELVREAADVFEEYNVPFKLRLHENSITFLGCKLTFVHNHERIVGMKYDVVMFDELSADAPASLLLSRETWRVVEPKGKWNRFKQIAKELMEGK